MEITNHIYQNKNSLETGLSSVFFPLLEEQTNFYYKPKNPNHNVTVNTEKKHIINEGIKNLLNVLKDELVYYVEYPYTDALYKDSYSRYYSTSLIPSGRFCVRVSIFLPKGKKIKDDIDYLISNSDFLGFFIIRPNKPISYGRTAINPKALKSNDFICCLTSITAHVCGFVLSTKVFPHSTQDGIAYSCSEIVIWCLMEYFGTKYSKYGTVLPSSIHRILKKISFERQLPSRGMTNDQIGYTLRKLGFGSIKYLVHQYGSNIQYIISDYIESGIPIIVTVGKSVVSEEDLKQPDINSKPATAYYTHTILLVGHNKIDYVNKLTYSNSEQLDIFIKKDKKNGSFSLLDSFDCYDKKFIVIDDNKPPYRESTLDNIASYYKELPISQFDIKEVIVPLYPKIYLEVVSARTVFKSALKNKFFGWKLSGINLINRLFLTSSNSFKRELRIKLKEKSAPTCLETLLKLVMPKFIYVIELSTPKYYKEKKGIGLIILDSTTSPYDSLENQLLFIAYPDRILIKENGSFNSSEEGLKEPFSLYINNLKSF